jgi:hypothetical protein
MALTDMLNRKKQKRTILIAACVVFAMAAIFVLYVVLIATIS